MDFRIKIFYTFDYEKLEEMINKWIESHDYIEIKDIKFSCTNHHDSLTFSALIIYSFDYKEDRW